ncbi:hypothetical protein A2U01_0062043, partial [Trifolium medium]|nr:hypothetical protein [Trifolium medium]
MFLTLSEFSGCFSNTSKKPGSILVSKTPLLVSWLSIPSCQKTSILFAEEDSDEFVSVVAMGMTV